MNRRIFSFPVLPARVISSAGPMTADPATLNIHIPDHTLLRVIGRGSYGEVWLARNVMGTLRAVKIVQRAAFESDRPWLREFEGIRRCEPVSRAHDGLIDILHVGRNDAEGFFYYVMELADDAASGGEIQKLKVHDQREAGSRSEPPSLSTFTFTDSYRPATLAARLAGEKALPVPDCLRLAESLAGALAFLHGQGLIHRDVKPSNVLYAGGVPKLGDIGLVAEAGSSRSFVGTEGFVPLEGPGTERADIFALGKVLYEALTGLDRSKFPQLPEKWRDDAGFPQRVELNEIVLRACEGRPDRRYASARELLAEVALLASGRSVKKLRGMEWRVRLLKWIAAAVAAAALLAAGTSWLWQRQASRERMLRERAVEAEAAQREATLQALLSQVHSARHDPNSTAVTTALKAATEAAAIRVTPELRDDTIFLLSRHCSAPRDDLTARLTLDFAAFHPASGLAAEISKYPSDSTDSMTVNVHALGAPEKTRAITIRNPVRNISALEFSRDGKRLLLTGRYGGGMVVDVPGGEVLTPFPEPGSTGSLLSFCGPAGDKLIRRANSGGFAIFSVPEMKRSNTPPVPDWPVREQEGRQDLHKVWPSPDGRFALLIDELLTLPDQTPPAVEGAACLVEIESGSIIWKIPGPVEQAAAWSSDGTRIAVRTAERILSVDAATGRVEGTVPERIYNFGVQLTFLDSRDILAYTTWSVSGVCDLARERMLGPHPLPGATRYDPETGVIQAAATTVTWTPPAVMKTYRPPLSPRNRHPLCVSISPDEEWVIAGDAGAFTWWRINDRDNVPEAEVKAGGASWVLFPGDGKTAVFLSGEGIHKTQWAGEPVKELPEADPGHDPDGPDGPRGKPGFCDYAAASTDGKVLAVGFKPFAAVHCEDGAPRVFWTGDQNTSVGVSPDGRWLGVGGHFATDVRVFDLHSDDDQSPRRISTGNGGYPCFSPRGTWLACSGLAEYFVLDTNTWNVVHRGPKEKNWVISMVGFTADESLMAVKHTRGGCTVLETGTWRTLYHLDSPLLEGLGRCSLSAKGRYLAAGGTRGEIYLWDLKAIDRELTERGLATGKSSAP
jgi:serine/threonine protein kinase